MKQQYNKKELEAIAYFSKEAINATENKEDEERLLFGERRLK